MIDVQGRIKASIITEPGLQRDVAEYRAALDRLAACAAPVPSASVPNPPEDADASGPTGGTVRLTDGRPVDGAVAHGTAPTRRTPAA